MCLGNKHHLSTTASEPSGPRRGLTHCLPPEERGAPHRSSRRGSELLKPVFAVALVQSARYYHLHEPLSLSSTADTHRKAPSRLQRAGPASGDSQTSPRADGTGSESLVICVPLRINRLWTATASPRSKSFCNTHMSVTFSCKLDQGSVSQPLFRQLLFPQ